jgi:uncharacterized membrane protein
MAWDFDMSIAPKGTTEQRHRKGKDGETVVYSQHVSAKILAAADDGKTVTVSNWIPDQQRWNMFAKEHPPIAWMPWPDHPGA